MKGEIIAQTIPIESIRDPPNPYVAKLKTSKEIYDKLVELLFVSTTGEIISLRTKLYKKNISKEEGIASYFMRVSQIRDQLQELGEILSNKEMTTVVLNALPKEWGNFVSSIYEKKETTLFSELWSLCKIDETTLKAKSDVGASEQVQAFVAMARRKGEFGKFGPQGHFMRDCLKLKKDNKKRKERIEAHITKEVEEPEEKKSKKEGIDLHY